MAKDAFGTNVNRPNAGGFKPPPPGYQKNDTGKPGGTPTGSVPNLNPGSWVGKHVAPIAGTGKTISSQKPFMAGPNANC